jgi:hypothetical protein
MLLTIVMFISISSLALAQHGKYDNMDYDKKERISRNRYENLHDSLHNRMMLLRKDVMSDKRAEDYDNCKLKSKGVLLSINPEYSTLLGSDSTEVPRGIALKMNGDIVLVGHTRSPGFPITKNGYSQKYAGGDGDGFITIFSYDCSRLISSTCFGGSVEDYLQAVRVLSDGSIVMVGTTSSPDLPVTDNALQKIYSGESDGYMAIFDSSCSKLQYCSYIGGSRDDHISGLDVGGNGYLYITGYTESLDFPRKRQMYNYKGGYDDSFVYVFDPDADTLIFSSYFGGNDLDQAYDIKLDCHSNICISGGTISRNLPTTSDALLKDYVSGSWNMGFIHIIDSSMKRTLYCTYIGGSASDIVEAVDFDMNDNIYVTGQTISPDFVTTTGVYMPNYPKKNQPLISYVMKLTKERKLEWSTFLGGIVTTYLYAIRVLKDESILLYGYSNSPDYPTTFGKSNSDEEIQTEYKNNAVISILSNDASRLIYSKVSGGNGNDFGEDLVLDENNIYFFGQTSSTDFPITENAYQKENKGQYDIFVSVMDIDDLLMSDERTCDAKRSIEMFTWPNPMKDRLYLKLNSATTTPEFYSLSISDIQGREVYGKTGEKVAGTELTEQIEVGSLRPGVYVCKATLGRHMQIRKVIKK